MMKLAIIGGLLGCVALLVSNADAQDRAGKRRGGQQLNGSVVILEQDGQKETVNTGGLVVISVSDDAGKPVGEVSTDAGRAFRNMGQVHGARVVEGKTVAGGGHTWLLLQPRNAGTHEFSATYQKQGKEEKLTFTVEVTEEESKGE